MIRVKLLQQRLCELREREMLAKQHNKELLQQFDEAQVTLRELLDRTTAMKRLKREYECHIGSGFHWGSQFHYKTADLFRGPHVLPSRPLQEHPLTTNYQDSSKHLSQTISQNECTDELILWPTKTEIISQSESIREDNSHSEDLDSKPVRLSSDQTESKSKNHTSKQGNTQKRKKSSSSEDRMSSHKSSSSRDIITSSEAITFISENEYAKICSKKSNNKKPTIGETEQSLSGQSSPEDKKDDDSEQADEDKEESSQEDEEMSVKDVTRCSSLEVDHKTLISESASSSSASESASSECDGTKDKLKTSESSRDVVQRPEDSDSEDCIVSPQTRSKTKHVIPEHEAETQNEETSSGDDNSDSSSDGEDIERVLAPQKQKPNQRSPNADKPTEPRDTQARLSVKDGQTDHHSGSNESDSFYD